MEFNKLATAKHHDNGAECNILDPVSGEPTDFYIKICGADSKVWRKQKKIQTRKLLNARSQSDEPDFDYEKAGIDFEEGFPDDSDQKKAVKYQISEKKALKLLESLAIPLEIEQKHLWCI